MGRKMSLQKTSIYLLAGIMVTTAAFEASAGPFNRRHKSQNSFNAFLEDATNWGNRGYRSRFSLIETSGKNKPIFKSIKAEPFVALRNSKIEYSVPEHDFAKIIFAHLTGKPPVTVSPAAFKPSDNQAKIEQASYEPDKTGDITEGITIPEPLKIHAKDRDQVIDFYSNRDFTPIWLTDGKLTARAKKLIAYLQTVEAHGLKKSDYQITLLNDFSPDIAHLGDETEALAQLELELSRAAAAYARHASAGRVIPDQLSRFNTMMPKQAMADEVLAELSTREDPGVYLETLQPQGKRYQALKEALADYRTREKTPALVKIPAGPTLKPGMKHGRVVLLRKRLEAAGLYEMPSNEKIEGQPDAEAKTEVEAKTEAEAKAEAALFEIEFFDEGLREAVRAFQKENALHPDGYVGRRTLAKLNGDKKDHVQQIILNMERLRWLPQELGKRHVFVNQAEYRMRLIDEGTEIHSARVIIGKYRHQTPVFSDEMETVVLNPYWNVPQSIIKNELLPSGNLGGYEIFQGGKRISAYQIDYPGERLHIRQPPGARNALGYVKFLFPNEHHVYMHDTPTRHLFQRENRTFSHGCVRVHHAQKLAHKILGLDQPEWTPAKITAGIKRGNNQHIKLKTKIPVYITYLTAWADENGVMQFSDDFYGRDKHLTTVLNTYQNAKK